MVCGSPMCTWRTFCGLWSIPLSASCATATPSTACTGQPQTTTLCGRRTSRMPCGRLGPSLTERSCSGVGSCHCRRSGARQAWPSSCAPSRTRPCCHRGPTACGPSRISPPTFSGLRPAILGRASRASNLSSASSWTSAGSARRGRSVSSRGLPCSGAWSGRRSCGSIAWSCLSGASSGRAAPMCRTPPPPRPGSGAAPRRTRRSRAPSSSAGR
mmetsp:Transcript_26803/g.77250  ORF Transcript_26803/g.77250 Transcript_26803/m.77250 type:complete len:214 (-) Transcript_26803:69-710(-)